MTTEVLPTHQAPLRAGIWLDDRYAAQSGVVVLSGIQALARVTLDQRRLDARRGLNTGMFVSGYPGSPLGGLDQELRRSARHLEPAGVVFSAGLNEELAATAVAGTQLLGELEHRRRDAVTGIWFGKNPGFDRAADAIRHGNISGTAPLGGAVAWIGDDPSAKSSTVPSACEPMCRSLIVPVLAPGTVQELLSLGLHAIALSRHAGLWSGLKVVADIADASMSVDVGAAASALPEFEPRAWPGPPVLLAPANLDAEQDLMSARLQRAHEYARVADLNRIAFEPTRPRFAIVSAGVSYQAVTRALDDLGLERPGLDALGIRLVQLRMPWPLEHAELRRLLDGVETVLVVEDKLGFVESRIKEALYGSARPPLVVGKHDATGAPLLGVRSSLGADDVAPALARVIGRDLLPDGARDRLVRLELPLAAAAAELPVRTPYFCSGCPHNVSTRAAPDQLVGVGIGCHTMVALDDGDRRGRLTGMPQMGGEGAQWLGLAPFTDDDHFIQNLGDGTFHHSGSLAIRAAVASGQNITYRLLYNGAVAMTGGQAPPGKLDVPTLTHWLATEGVKQVAITTPEPGGYAGAELAAIASVRHRDELTAVQRQLAQVPGVTVLIHDDQCATEKRRLRKRGKLPAPAQRVVINERVCEGCGDCGERSTCLSVVPVQTEFGRKTQIHQASCNADLTCLKGDCPSFMLVEPDPDAAELPASPATTIPVKLTEPLRRVPADALIRMCGVGGTGVVTVSAILQMAAHLEGRHAAGLEQIGLAQKGGPVLSDLRFRDRPIEGQVRATTASVDALVGFDLVGAASAANLALADPARTAAVLSTSNTPTAGQVTDPRALATDTARALRRIERATRGEPLAFDAITLSERLFGDHLPANLIVAGAAYQHGCLPVGADAIEAAIELNGAAVERNVAAFRWGRAVAIDQAAVERALAPAPVPHVASAAARAIAAGAVDAGAGLAVDPQLRRLLESRVEDLIAYQDEAYARRYVADVNEIATIATGRVGDAAEPVLETYARGLHRLMAYKDEYEVARLHLLASERERVTAQFGPNAKVRILLHPPALRALGLDHKIALGPWVRPALRVLQSGRHLRGTRLDPFARARVRRVERSLIGQYRELVREAALQLDEANAEQVVEIAALADLVRGYEDIKLRSVDEFRTRSGGLSQRLARAPDGATGGRSQPSRSASY